jgi:hypothetical protein
MLTSALLVLFNVTLQTNDDEFLLGYGVEPSVVTNRRRNDQGNRVLVWYMTNQGIVRKRNQAAGDPDQWETDTTITQEVGTVKDPAFAAHPSNAHLYAAWLSPAGWTASIQARRSPETDTLDQPETVVSSSGADRPWLAANAQSLYCVWALLYSNVAYVRRAAIGGLPNSLT